MMRLLIVSLLLIVSSNADEPSYQATEHHWSSVLDLPDVDIRAEIADASPAVQATALAELNKMNLAENDLFRYHLDKVGGKIYVEDPLPLPTAQTHQEYKLEQAQYKSILAKLGKYEVQNNGVPSLSSKPGATHKVFLDFDGATIPTSSAWVSDNNARVAKPCSLDSDGTTFTQQEQDNIAIVWAMMAEDFRPFDIDVTTVDPGTTAARIGHCLFTDDTDANGRAMPSQGAGGVAYVGVWGASYFPTYLPAFVYIGFNSPKNMAEAGSHEVGHNLGLNHDGTSTKGYFGGYGSGATSWGPIMGTGYGRSVSQWSKGEYPDANNQQDDLNQIDTKLGYRADDVGNTNAAASTVTYPSQTTISATGIIERNTDVDVWKFDTGAGSVSISVKPFYGSGTVGNNLDVKLVVKNSGGSTLATSAGKTVVTASYSGSLSAGTYYLWISPDANTDFYTTYGSLGQYEITGTIQASSTVTCSGIPSSINTGTMTHNCLSGSAVGTTCSASCSSTTYGTSRTFTCGSNGQWSGTAISCTTCTQISQCATTETCTSASNSQCANCNSGYTKVDGTQDQCLRTCPNLNHGTGYSPSSCSGGKEGDQCVVSCANGYTSTTATSSLTYQCSSGTWSASGSLTCVIACPDMTIIPYTTIGCTAGKLPGETCSVACSATTHGPLATYTCGSDGQWSGEVPSCTTCESIDDCTSTETCESATTSQCTSCSDGHYLKEGLADTCPQCPAIENCLYPSSCSSASTAKCATCTPGYYKDTSGDADVCRACEPITNCQSAVTCNSDQDSQCTSCNAGFVLVQGTRDVCRPPGGCATLSLGSSFNTDECNVGLADSQTCSVKCADGYYGSPSTYTCDDGSFTGTQPSCTACPLPTGCTASVCTSASNVQCTACQSGRYLSDDGQCVVCPAVQFCTGATTCTSAETSQCSTQTCTSGYYHTDGTFDECVPTGKCPTLQLPEYGTHTDCNAGSDVGTTCTARCNAAKGWQGGTSTYTCTGTGNPDWTGQYPACFFSDPSNSNSDSGGVGFAPIVGGIVAVMVIVVVVAVVVYRRRNTSRAEGDKRRMSADLAPPKRTSNIHHGHNLSSNPVFGRGALPSAAYAPPAQQSPPPTYGQQSPPPAYGYGANNGYNKPNYGNNNAGGYNNPNYGNNAGYNNTNFGYGNNNYGANNAVYGQQIEGSANNNPNAGGYRRPSIGAAPQMVMPVLSSGTNAGGPPPPLPPRNALPAGWVEYVDDESGFPYWYNASTGESKWERPQ